MSDQTDPAPHPQADYLTPTFRWFAARALRIDYARLLSDAAVSGATAAAVSLFGTRQKKTTARQRFVKRAGQVAVGLGLAIGAVGGFPHVIPAITSHFPFHPTPPGPAPVPVPKGMRRVVFAYESSNDLTRPQLASLYSGPVRDYLDANLPKGPDGIAAWRCWDKDVDVTSESQDWQAAWAKAKPLLGQLPQLVVFDSSDRPVASPLPAGPDELLALLKKIGG